VSIAQQTNEEPVNHILLADDYFPNLRGKVVNESALALNHFVNGLDIHSVLLSH
jgi:hypothetical protein